MKHGRENAIALTASAIFGLGLLAAIREGALGGSENCRTINGASRISLIGVAKDGGFLAKNTGECVDVYNPVTLKTVGRLARTAIVDVECIDGPKPAAFRIVGNFGLHGDIDLASSMISRLPSPGFKQIPEC